MSAFCIAKRSFAYCARMASTACWRPGVSGWLFFGSRSFNFHSSYVMAGGLLLGVERDLRDPNQSAVVIAAQIDGLVLALPFVLGYEWLAGRNEEGD